MSGDRGCAVNLASRRDEVHGIKEIATSVALIPASIRVFALRTYPFHESVCQKPFVLRARAKQLELGFLLNVSILVKFVEYCLRDLCLLWSCRTSEMVKTDVEPFVYSRVNGIVLITDFLRRDIIFDSFRLDGSAIFVGAADVQDV